MVFDKRNQLQKGHLGCIFCYFKRFEVHRRYYQRLAESPPKEKDQRALAMRSHLLDTNEHAVKLTQRRQ